jgi:hypothetical protein
VCFWVILIFKPISGTYITTPHPQKDGEGEAENLVGILYKFNCGKYSNTTSILHQKKYYHTFVYLRTRNDSQL